MMLRAWTPEELLELSLFYLDQSYFDEFVFRRPGSGKRYRKEGVRLMEEYKDVLTDDEEQRKIILHCVKQTRKLYPDFKKSTLA